jgi:hypothetical protein
MGTSKILNHLDIRRNEVLTSVTQIVNNAVYFSKKVRATVISALSILLLLAGSGVFAEPSSYDLFMPDIPSLEAPADNPNAVSDTYILTLVEDEYPAARSNKVFVRFISETMGVCKIRESSPVRNFLCSDWLLGQTYRS